MVQTYRAGLVKSTFSMVRTGPDEDQCTMRSSRWCEKRVQPQTFSCKYDHLAAGGKRRVAVLP
jgi:hypothetical protein